MIRSMTGFGRGEFSDGKRNVIAEIKTVNHRYADISIKMPKRYSFAEEKLKAIIKNQVKRGKVDVSIIVENLTEGDITISLNKPVADQYIERLRELKDGYDLEGEIDIKLLSSMPDVLKIIPDVADEEEVSAAICKAVELAAANLDEMRTREGEKLATDLLARGETIKEIVRKISERAPKVAIEYKEKMYNRIQDILEDKVDVPEERILVEAAIFADKASITEELVRLDSHMDQLKTFLTKGIPDARREE